MSWREDEESVRGREISERVVRCNILMSISVVTLYFRARLPLRVRIRVNVDSYEKGFFFSSLPSFLSLFNPPPPVELKLKFFFALIPKN